MKAHKVSIEIIDSKKGDKCDFMLTFDPPLHESDINDPSAALKLANAIVGFVTALKQ